MSEVKERVYEGYASSEKLAPLVREIAWSHNLVILEYALFDATKPIGVATYRIRKRLPKELRGSCRGRRESQGFWRMEEERRI